MPWFAPDYNVAPQSTQPVVRLNADTGKPEFALMRWGLVPYWAKDAKIGYSTINARAEEAAAKPLFVKHSKSADASFRRMPSTNGSRSTQKRSGHLRSHCKAGSPTPSPVCGSGGNPETGEPLETFTILTTDPNALAERVHNRMPVILEPRDYSRWMEPGDPARPPIDLLRPYPAEKMHSWPVDERVGNVRNNDAELLNERPPENLLF